MLATSAARLREGEHWSYEAKWGGYRTLAGKDGARVTLLSRNLKDATAGEIELLDGEIVAIDECRSRRHRSARQDAPVAHLVGQLR